MKNKKNISYLLKNGWLYGNNQTFLNYLYKKFLSKSSKIEGSWKKVFENIEKFNYENNSINFYKKKDTPKHKNEIIQNNFFKKFKFPIHERFVKLVNAYRKLGHYIAKTDPLQYNTKVNIKELSLSFYEIKKEDLNKKVKYNIFSYQKDYKSYNDLYIFLNQTYCSSVGFEYMHLYHENEKIWLQKYIESKFYSYKTSEKTKKNILQGLIKSKMFEKFIHNKFPGSKRFSLEGCDVLIPILQKIIHYSIKNNTKKLILGMSHRGRLNVMFNIFKSNIPKMYQDKLNYIKKIYNTGDVKYHLGAYIKIQNNLNDIEFILLDNPSHLEIITPIILGSCRAFIDNIKNYKSNFIVPIIIHGDAAFIGQGVIQETLNMSQVPGYCVFGSIHIIINNRIGFTTSKKKYLQSSIYCSDIAKMIDSPIFHVNADDPDSVIFIIKLAFKFRLLFKKDVFIDLVCYRKLGHNEIDDPSITQPVMYKEIKNHKHICTIYLNKLLKFNDKNKNIYQDFYNLYKKKLYNNLKNKLYDKNNAKLESNFIINKHTFIKNSKNYFSFKRLINKIYKIFIFPKNFFPHHQIKKVFNNRLEMIHGKKLWDWGGVEILAYAALMLKGIRCRLTGEDVRRGTFSHRHAVIYCQKTNKKYIPLKNLTSFKGEFDIWDSVLSEEATLAFEYGYSISSKFSLNIWEAQFGDFANGAQVVIDQFITSSQQKWGHNSSLVMMLPHGYEGQGPEHSSARLERYLQLCAQKNIYVSIPTTTAQFYHLLQNQGKAVFKKPLIILTPKSLLRNPKTFSTLKDLSDGKFHKILLNKNENINNKIKKIIFCTGKIYYEILKFCKIKNLINILLVRIEQLYPFPKKEIKKIIINNNNATSYIWCQEEPMNQGAWTYFYFNFKKNKPDILKKIILKYFGRPKWASTSEGDLYSHNIRQDNIIYNACMSNS